MYTIEPVPSEQRVEITFGKYTDHDNERFMQDVQEAALNVKGSGDHFEMLCDFSQSMVMPQDIANDSKTIVAWLLANGLRKSANVMQSPTQRMQVARVTQRDEKFSYFTTRKDALAWLAEGDI